MGKGIIIYHNAHCSKSRCAIDYLNKKGFDFEIVEYLKDLPTIEILSELISKLGIKPEQLIRKGEADFKNNFKGKTLTDEEWIKAMIQFPKLIERPIVVKDGKAVIARPTERINEII